MPEQIAVIHYLLNDFHMHVLPDISKELVRRDLSLGALKAPKIGSTAKAIVGMRRSGKTFRLYQEIIDLIAWGISPDHICYFNFDDDRLRPYTNSLINDVVEAFFELHPETRTKGAYFFFDEVQDVPNWGLALRRLQDTEKVALYVTGSSSKMLSEEIATEFRGRSLTYELLPFSFREYLRAQGLEPQTKQELASLPSASRLKKELKKYLVEGGFPATFGLDDMERAQILQSYAQLTVARDVVERTGFTNATFARLLARSALTSSAREVSISRLDHKAKSSGYSPGRTAIANLLDAFEDAHLCYQVYSFGYSAQKIRLGGMKLYAADPGLYWATSIASLDGLTYALETAIYLELRRRRTGGRLGDIAMLKLKSGREVDFVEGDSANNTAHMLVQVCLNMQDQKTKTREIQALVEATQLLGKTEAYIITLDKEEELKVEATHIHVVPAWKWLLQQQ